MLWNPLAAIAGSLFCLMIALVFLVSVRRSSFGWLIIFSEYFYVLGLGIFPLLMSVGLIDAPQLAIDYELGVSQMHAATFFHIILYGIGALFGYFFVRPLSRGASKKVVSFARANLLNNYTWFYAISALSILFSTIYVINVGLEKSIVNASLTRGGDFSGLIGSEQYQFLKTLAMIGLFSMVFVPYIIIDAKRIKSSFLIIVFIAIPIYVLTVARVTFLDTFVLFAILYFSLSRAKFGSGVFIFSLTLFMILVLLFGKVFVGAISVYFFGDGSFNLITREESPSAIFFGHFGHLVYSIDAGIRNFILHGPVIYDDILLSPLGFLPSFVFSAMGLDFLSYQLVEDAGRLSCINTYYFPGSDECSVPPYFPGVSAYILPVFGGLVFGFIKFFVYAVIELSWIRLQNSPVLIWVPLFLLLVSNRLFLVIPNTISFAVFVSIAFLFFLKLRHFLFK